MRYGDNDPIGSCVFSGASRGTDSRYYDFSFQQQALLDAEAEKLPVVSVVGG